AYRARVRALIAALDKGELVSDAIRAELRALVDLVDVTPTSDGHSITLVGSLEAALNTGGTPQRRAPLAHTLVAKEGLEPPTPGL
ncbi:MAG: recombinase, partial [Sphingomonas bacterium]|nr:recombinase [Sphingomonas bacterium]